MPAGGRPTDTASPGNAGEAGVVIDVFAEEVEATAQNDPGYCNVALDPVHDGLKVWWHGTPSAAVLAVLDRARIARITPVVLPTKFPHALLSTASSRVVAQMGKLGISFVGVSIDCSGLDVGLVNDTATELATFEGAHQSLPCDATRDGRGAQPRGLATDGSVVQIATR